MQTRATAEQTVDVGLWMLAAERLGTTQWEEATTADTAQAFWNAIRDKVQQVIRAPSSGPDFDYLSAGLPLSLTRLTNSQVFVPLFLDSASLLTEGASRAWRQHELSGPHWDRWVQQLRGAARIPLLILGESLAEELQRQQQARHAGPDQNVCLMWQSAARAAVQPDMTVSLADIMQNSITQRGYVPGLAQ